MLAFDYGKNLGLAFHLIDDVLDFTGTSSSLGKGSLSDIRHENFDPIVDVLSGRDYIPSMVYGRNIRGQDLSGMYCAILTVNSTVVSAGLLRIFGRDLAELPLVATTKENQGKLNNYRKKCWKSLAQETRNPDHRLLVSVNNHKRQLATSLKTVKWQVNVMLFLVFFFISVDLG
ncbi:hypothetical protein AgCh_022194 [Apium graveolens]